MLASHIIVRNVFNKKYLCRKLVEITMLYFMTTLLTFQRVYSPNLCSFHSWGLSLMGDSQSLIRTLIHYCRTVEWLTYRTQKLDTSFPAFSRADCENSHFNSNDAGAGTLSKFASTSRHSKRHSCRGFWKKRAIKHPLATRTTFWLHSRKEQRNLAAVTSCMLQAPNLDTSENVLDFLLRGTLRTVLLVIEK